MWDRPMGESGASGIVQQTHLLKELFFQMVSPALVCLAICRQVTNVSALQHHLHQCNNTITFTTTLPFTTILPLWYTDDMSHGSTFGCLFNTLPPPVNSQQPQLVLNKLLLAHALLRLHWQCCLQSVMHQWTV